MRPIFPGLRVLLAETEVGLVDECRCLKRVFLALVSQIPHRDLVQLRINALDQLLFGAKVTAAQAFEQPRHIAALVLLARRSHVCGPECYARATRTDYPQRSTTRGSSNDGDRACG